MNGTGDFILSIIIGIPIFVLLMMLFLVNPPRPKKYEWRIREEIDPQRLPKAPLPGTHEEGPFR